MSATAMKEPETLEDEMWNVAEHTRADGQVDAEVTEVKSSGDGEKIVVKYRLPNGDHPYIKYDKPGKDSKQYEFIRLLDGYGYDLRSMKQLEGTIIETEQDDDDGFVPVIPESTTSAVIRSGQTFSRFTYHFGAGLLGPITLIFAWLHYTFDDVEKPWDDPFEAFLIGTIFILSSVLLWLVISIVVWLLVFAGVVGWEVVEWAIP